MQIGRIRRDLQVWDRLGKTGERFADKEPVPLHGSRNNALTTRNISTPFRQPPARRCYCRQNAEAFNADFPLDLFRGAESSIEILPRKCSAEATNKAENRRNPQRDKGLRLALFKRW